MAKGTKKSAPNKPWPPNSLKKYVKDRLDSTPGLEKPERDGLHRFVSPKDIELQVAYSSLCKAVDPEKIDGYLQKLCECYLEFDIYRPVSGSEYKKWLRDMAESSQHLADLIDSVPDSSDLILPEWMQSIESIVLPLIENYSDDLNLDEIRGAQSSTNHESANRSAVVGSELKNWKRIPPSERVPPKVKANVAHERSIAAPKFPIHVRDSNSTDVLQTVKTLSLLVRALRATPLRELFLRLAELAEQEMAKSPKLYSESELSIATPLKLGKDGTLAREQNLAKAIKKLTLDLLDKPNHAFVAHAVNAITGTSNFTAGSIRKVPI